MLEAGADPNLTDEFGRTPLHWAARRASHCVKLLLAAGADPNVVDSHSTTPLHWLAYADKKVPGMRFHDVCELLIASGTDISVKDVSDRTALDITETRIRESFWLEKGTPAAEERALMVEYLKKADKENYEMTMFFKRARVGKDDDSESDAGECKEVEELP